MNIFRLISTKKHSSSSLRGKFESLDGIFEGRNIRINKVSNNIFNLEDRPEYYPSIILFQLKRINENSTYLFSEEVYTSNEFLSSFENFLRSNVEDIQAENFEDVPKGYIHYYQTDYTLVQCDIKRTAVYPIPLKGKLFKIEHDEFKGIDYDSSCILRMIAPEILYNKMDEIEKSTTFSAYIIKTQKLKDDEYIAFEKRYGNEHVTRVHILFTRQE